MFLESRVCLLVLQVLTFVFSHTLAVLSALNSWQELGNSTSLMGHSQPNFLEFVGSTTLQVIITLEASVVTYVASFPQLAFNLMLEWPATSNTWAIMHGRSSGWRSALRQQLAHYKGGPSCVTYAARSFACKLAELF